MNNSGYIAIATMNRVLFCFVISLIERRKSV
jgi:hypothetical protein